MNKQRIIWKRKNVKIKVIELTFFSTVFQEQFRVTIPPPSVTELLMQPTVKNFGQTLTAFYRQQLVKPVVAESEYYDRSRLRNRPNNQYA